MKQITNKLLMIRPHECNYNEETAKDNKFQKGLKGVAKDELTKRAQEEFDGYVKLLKDSGIDVTVWQDDEKYYTPDAHFPNNWISFHNNDLNDKDTNDVVDNKDNDKMICLYPMYSKCRRLERRNDIIKHYSEKCNYKMKDWTAHELDPTFCEGTGSLIFDHIDKKVYASISVRTTKELVEKIAKYLKYEPIVFSAKDDSDTDIYHTNCVLCIGIDFAIICTEAIKDKDEKKMVVDSLEKSGKTVVDFSMKQLFAFVGNMLQVKNKDNKKFLVMSKTARNALDEKQIEILKTFNDDFIVASLDIIEKIGGGSSRCMLTEIF